MAAEAQKLQNREQLKFTASFTLTLNRFQLEDVGGTRQFRENELTISAAPPLFILESSN